MILILSLFAAYWFKREFQRFSTRINQQIYHDYCQLQPQAASFQQFLQHSTLQPKMQAYAAAFYLLFPLSMAIFADQSEPIQISVIILLYLSLLDYCYYLTDSRYIALIFLAGVAQLLFYTPETMPEALFNLFCISLFFALFLPLTALIIKKEAFGLGDVLLLLALCPFFTLPQMLELLLHACLLGLLFALLYFCKYQHNIQRLPFIPFMTLAIFNEWMIG